jgi:FKBP-type peptidyl-prolyl cis-trans isomerase FkpA
MEFPPMNPVFRSVVLATALMSSAAAFAQAPAAKPAANPAAKPVSAVTTGGLTTERQKNSYMVGMDVAKSLEPFKDELDLNVMVSAIQAVFAKKPTALTEAQADQLRAAFSQKLQARMSAQAAADGQKNLEAGNRFLAANRTKPGVRTTASGLQYQVLRPGAGPTPKSTDTVKVDYKGTLLNGKTFDSSYDRGQPAEFALNQVIPGWSEGVALMPVGSKYKFWIPASLGYGPNGPPTIGPNAMLTFEVELKSISK